MTSANKRSPCFLYYIFFTIRFLCRIYNLEFCSSNFISINICFRNFHFDWRIFHNNLCCFSISTYSKGYWCSKTISCWCTCFFKSVFFTSNKIFTNNMNLSFFRCPFFYNISCILTVLLRIYYLKFCSSNFVFTCQISLAYLYFCSSIIDCCVVVFIY